VDVAAAAGRGRRRAPGRGGPAAAWAGVFEDVLGAPVVLRSYAPTAAAKRGLASAAIRKVSA
jgi:hypothetical protein